MPLLLNIINALRLLVIVDALATWVQRESEFPRSFTSVLTEPVYRPLRAIFSPYTGRFDASPLIVLVVLQVVAMGVRRAGTGSRRRQ